jgi:3-deoxy-D-manno-octulosonate 8-phosphate phosphatase (KDO 8-P phosphatase)
VNALEDRLRGIRLLLLDVDGVLTDGRLVYSGPTSKDVKVFDVKDGLGIAMLTDSGTMVGILSSRESRVVNQRAAELGIKIVHQDAMDKVAVYERIIESANLVDDEVAYMGDDLVDVPVMRRVGFAAAPADAAPDVVRHAHYVCARGGGRGAVREVCEMLLKAQGAWEAVEERYQLR